MMYRIKHVPSGRYFIPSRHIIDPAKAYNHVKSNLSKTGKVYHRKPTMPKGTIYDTSKPKRTDARYSEESYLYPVVATEWVLEEIP
jgi:hypothetical protein